MGAKVSASGNDAPSKRSIDKPTKPKQRAQPRPGAGYVGVDECCLLADSDEPEVLEAGQNEILEGEEHGVVSTEKGFMAVWQPPDTSLPWEHWEQMAWDRFQRRQKKEEEEFRRDQSGQSWREHVQRQGLRKQSEASMD